MRVGFNPNKDKELEKSNYNHQVIIPVYIPHQEEYFKDSFKILKLCLESLFITSHFKTYFTIVNNGSCQEITNYLNLLQSENKIQEVIHTSAIGKLNAVLKGLTGHQFELITISDADVLFLSDWQKATYKVFEAFPKAGAVSPVPNSKMLRYYTANIIWDTLFSNKVKFTSVLDKNSMLSFAKSVNNTSMFKEVHLSKNLTITNNSVSALVGAGHFVVTYNAKSFDKLNKRYSKYSLGGDSEQEFLDKPLTKLGMYRLSTENNFAFHMGNTVEPWMESKLAEITIEKNKLYSVKLDFNKKCKLTTWFKVVLFSRIIFKKPIWQVFLRYKGLSKEEANQY